MRIITVLDSYPPDLNGGAYFTHRLALGLQQRGHELLVICPSRTFKQGYSDYEGVRLYGVRSWPVSYKNFRVCWPLFIKKAIIKAIKEFNPDLVHLQGKFFLGGICYRASKKMDIPIIATNHFMPENFFHYTHLPKRCMPWFKKKCWSIVIDMLNNVEIITTPTVTAAQLLKQEKIQKQVHVISCGIDLNKFHPKQDAEFLRMRYHIPEKLILLYAGRLDKEKNLKTALQAFAKARQQVDFHFVIVGSGAEKNSLERLVHSLGVQNEVTFTGYLSDEDYPKIHGLADCFINAGTAELQSIVALEAVASGLPMLGADAMALPELIIPEKNGYLFASHDVTSLANFMSEVFSNSEQRKRMGIESRKIAEGHDINRTIAQYEQLYEGLLLI
jgi:glycosyltransferase involved in cell wall biosynthesis